MGRPQNRASSSGETPSRVGRLALARAHVALLLASTAAARSRHASTWVPAGCAHGITLRVGAGYTVIPLDERARDWLASEGHDVPTELGRLPTEVELAAAIASLTGIVAEERPRTGALDVELRGTGARSGWGASLWSVRAEQAPRPVPVRITLHKPSVPLALALLEAVSRTCGPQLLVCEPSMRVAVVFPGCDLEEAARHIEHRSPTEPPAAGGR